MTDEGGAGFDTLGELESAGAKRADRSAWAYVEGGAGEEVTLAANRRAFARRTLRTRVLAGIAELDLSTTILGSPVRSPFFVAPTAYHGALHPDAEGGTARAAARAGILAVFSTLSSLSLEEIAESRPTGPRWFQLYLQPDFAATRKLVERAERAGYGALVLTADVPVLGARDRQAEAGFAIESSVPIGNGPEVVPPARAPTRTRTGYVLRADGAASWEILDRLREVSRLPIVVKGILTGADALEAVRHGARAILVSNHGCRQLDRAPASLDALEEVVAAVGSRAEVYLDGGVRRGSDVLIALASGARAVGLGRPVLWALAAGGEAGVARLFRLLDEELATALALTGCARVREVSEAVIGTKSDPP